MIPYINLLSYKVPVLQSRCSLSSCIYDGQKVSSILVCMVDIILCSHAFVLVKLLTDEQANLVMPFLCEQLLILCCLAMCWLDTKTTKFSKYLF